MDTIITFSVMPLILSSVPLEAKLIYTISAFQNPTGVTLSQARRVRLLELALFLTPPERPTASDASPA